MRVREALTTMPEIIHLECRMRSRKEFDKARHNAARNDAVDGWIIFLGKELSELCGSFDLARWII